MTSPGTNLGSAFYEILPDLKTGKFTAAGVQAGTALAAGLSSALAKSTGSANSMLIQTMTKSLGAAGRAGGAAFTGALGGAVSSARGAIGIFSAVGGAIRGVSVAAGGAAAALGGGLWRGMNLASDATRSLGSHMGVMSFQLQMMGSMMTSLVTGPLAALGFGMAQLGLTTAMTIQDSVVGLKAILPPGYDVLALVERLQKLAVSSPVFAVDQLFAFTRKLVGAGVDAGNAEQILDSINKIFITYGVTGASAEKALLGVSQVFQKGRPYAEELTQQIGEQIPIWNLMSQVTGQTQAELMKTVTAGEMTSDQFAQLLIQMGQLPSIAEGAAGGVSTLRAQFTILKESVQQSLAQGFLPELDRLGALLKDVTPLVNEVVSAFVDSIPKAIDVMERLYDEVVKLRGQWDTLSDAQKTLAKNIALVTVAAGPALLVLGSVAMVLSSFIGFASMALNPWLILFTAVGTGFAYLYRTSEDFRMGLEALVFYFKRSMGKELPSIMKNLTSIGQTLARSFERIIVSFGFETWVEFGAFVGHNLPRILNVGLEKIRQSIDLVADRVVWLKAQWDGLDDVTKSHVKTMALWAAGAVTFLPAITAVATFVGLLATNLRLLLNPWSVAVGAVVAGFVYMYQESDKFREQTDLFVANFKTGIAQEMPGAVDALIKSLKELLGVINTIFPGLQNVQWTEMGGYLGETLPRLIAGGVRLIATGISALADGIDRLWKLWGSLEDTTQKNLITIAKWAAVAVVLAPAISALATGLGVLLTVTRLLVTPLTAGLAILGGGLYLAYTRVDEFQRHVDELVANFRRQFSIVMPGAIAHIVASLRELGQFILTILPPGTLEFFQDFGAYMGYLLPRLIAGGIHLVADGISFLTEKLTILRDLWRGLDDAQKEQIKRMALWAGAAIALAPVILPIASALGAVISTGRNLLTVFNPVLLALGAGFYLLYTKVDAFKYQVDTFVAAFKLGFDTKIKPALVGLKLPLKELSDAVLRVLGYFGLQSWKDFGGWAGVGLSDLISLAIRKIGGAIHWIADGMQRVMDKWDSLTPVQQDMILKWGGLAIAAVGVAGAVNKIAGAFGGLSSNLGFLVNPWTIAIGLIGFGLYELYQKNETFRQSVDTFRDHFMDAFHDKMPGAVQRLKDAFKNDLGPAFKDFAKALGFESLQDFSAWLGDKLGRGSAGGVDILSLAVHGLADGFRFLTEQMPAIKGHFHEFADKIDTLKGKWDDLSGAQQGALLGLLGAGAAVTMGGGTGVFGGISGLAGAGGGVLSAMWALGPAGLAGAAGIGLIGAAFVDAYGENDTFKGKVDDMARGFSSGFREHVLPQLKELWTSIVGGEGKKGLVPALVDLLVTLGGGTPEEAGRNFAAGLGYAVGGIRSFVDEVTPLIDGFGETWKNLIRAAASSLSTMSKLYNGFVDLNSKVGWALTGGRAQPKIADEQLNYFDALANGASMNDALMNFSDYRASLEWYRSLNDARARGGQRLASGGYVSGPGTSTSDSIPIWASNREFMINAASTAKYRATLEAINAGAPPGVVMATIPSVPGGRSTVADSQNEFYVTVLLDGQPIVERAQAVVDANNKATIRLTRSMRSAY